MATHQEQIEAILTGSMTEFVCKETGNSTITQADIRSIFTIRKSDIVAWVKQHGFPASSYDTEPRPSDGIYLVPTRSGLELYYQERGCKFASKTFSDLDEAIEDLVDMKIYYSGSDIK